ncbi:hypothetical protein [Streptomyces aquilus]|uniref:hypothetical protein n=1 Tax=Streptomyces aquilus TaxID=2548456 RepID=UPI00369163F2
MPKQPPSCRTNRTAVLGEGEGERAEGTQQQPGEDDGRAHTVGEGAGRPEQQAPEALRRQQPGGDVFPPPVS